MAINFPASPNLNDTFVSGGVTYTWDGTVWVASGPAAFVQKSGDTMTGDLTVPSVNGGHAGPDNLIVNGAMEVAQRSAAELNNVQSTGGLTYQTLDRWGYWSNASNLFSSNQVEDAPPGFYHSVQLKSLGNNAMGTGGYNTWSQRIEAQNLYQTGIGTANAKDFTLSFWVKASTAGTYALHAMNSGFNYIFTTTYTVDTANTWEHKTITITGPTSNFSATGNAWQLEIGFTLGAGTTYSTSTLNQWQSGNYLIGATGAINLVETINETLNITGVQLTATDAPVAFQYKDYGTELALCQRYYVGGRRVLGCQYRDTAGYRVVQMDINMRVIPTAAITDELGGPWVTSSSTSMYNYVATTTSAGTATAYATFALDAEL
jgi:hypothetical protein